ncbi:uncharacterized protein LTR77_006426 [Saxophila tyrrhenica]|uniref:AB hydrolase-1 domain-containing protein n=1 Tax=Saxophila tyrrhenica TaxID=1690608 RepID=A0AAV9PAY9_9PEZI|nr:hypothetical protein LTR77_006426 [Saxophila tyrrhenica]
MADPQALFQIKSHQTQASHLRSYRKSSRNENKPFTLDVKQYIPRNNLNPGEDDVTVVAAGGIGFPKECYEPLFAEILTRCNSRNLNVRGFWIADSASMGFSTVLNSGHLGSEVSWWDHSRDLLHLINTFHAEMPRPLVGLGHSMGAAQMAYLSTLHPSLFTSLVLIEPVIYPEGQVETTLTQMRYMLRRPEQWPSRAAAEKAIRKSPYYGSWDPRVLDRIVRHGLRERQSPKAGDIRKGPEGTPVRTVASKELEVAHIIRLNDRGVGMQGNEAITHEDRRIIPDMDPTCPSAPLYNPFTRQMFFLLPTLRPWVLYIDGESSPRATPENIQSRLETTGTGQGGSGGLRAGTIKHHFVKGGQHTIPLDMHLGEVACAAGTFIAEEMGRYRESLDKEDPVEDNEVEGMPKLDPKLLYTIENFKEASKPFKGSKL